MGAYKKEKKKKEESFFLLLQTKQGKEVYFSLFFSSFLFPNIYVKLFFFPRTISIHFPYFCCNQTQS